jgi:periplasmic protein TonB
MSRLDRIRTILVPQDIVGVCPRAPARARKHTPCRLVPDGQAPTARCGDRDWFSDRLFIESQDGHARSGFGTSVTVHLCGVGALIVFLLAQPDVVTIRMPSLPMPAVVAALPPPPVDSVQVQPAEQPRPRQTSQPAAPPPPPPTEGPADKPPAAPVEAPSAITPETTDTRVGGAPGGVPGGVAGGVPGGVVGGTPASGSGTGSPVRVGPKMESPRKIKNVRPIYPDGALPSRSQGAVVVDVTIGPDGKVKDVKVIHSVPALDQAAIDAVRQWEYTPPTLNGVAVAVIMTVVVNFAMQ